MLLIVGSPMMPVSNEIVRWPLLATLPSRSTVITGSGGVEAGDVDGDCGLIGCSPRPEGARRLAPLGLRPHRQQQSARSCRFPLGWEDCGRACLQGRACPHLLFPQLHSEPSSLIATTKSPPLLTCFQSLSVPTRNRDKRIRGPGGSRSKNAVNVHPPRPQAAIRPDCKASVETTSSGSPCVLSAHPAGSQQIGRCAVAQVPWEFWPHAHSELSS